MFNVAVTYDETTVRVAATVHHGYAVGSAELCSGVVREGLVTGPAAFGQALGRALAAAGISRASHQTVIVAVPERRVFSTLVELPYVPTSEQATAVAWQVQSALPGDLSQLAIAHKVLGPRHSERLTALAVAVPREVVEAVWHGCSIAGVTPAAIVPLSLGLAQLGYQEPNVPSLIASSDDPGTVTLIVTKNRTPRFSTTVAVSTTPAKFRQSVRHAIEFYESRDGQHRRIARILIFPGPNAAHFLKLLAEQPRLPPVSILHVPRRTRAGHASPDEYLATVGLLMVARPLNLLLPEHQAIVAARRHDRWFQLGWRLQVGLASLLVGWAGLIVAGQFIRASWLSPGIEALGVTEQAQLKRFGQLKAAVTATTTLQTKRTGLARAYAAVRAAQNSEIQLLTVTYDNETGVILVTGQRGSRLSLASFAQALRKTFATVSVPTSSWAEVDGGVFRVEVS